MGIVSNPEWEYAITLAHETNQSFFLTGQAGTGKSTLLKHILSTSKKSVVVLAPTGIAATNVGGVTIHAFFKFPLRPLTPNDVGIPVFPNGSNKYDVIHALDTIIIDEVSMASADLIDAIDTSLRLNTGNQGQPFGGKQMIFIGDVFQLEPVSREQSPRQDFIKKMYKSVYFFNAHVFKRFSIKRVELKRIYRQTEDTFMSLLSRVRVGSVTREDIAVLNSRFISRFIVDEYKDAIVLTTVNHRANEFNLNKLHEIKTDEHKYLAEVTGRFNLENCIAEPILILKVGARVMLLKNDPEGRWVNGTIGEVTRLESSRIFVRLPNGETFTVVRRVWENVEYKYDKDKNKFTEEVIGALEQFPVKLAYAITIHKSQGQTFDKVLVDFGSGTFASGQAYVALSRVRSFSGLYLARCVDDSDFYVNKSAVEYEQYLNSIAKHDTEPSKTKWIRDYEYEKSCKYVECFLGRVKAIKIRLGEEFVKDKNGEYDFVDIYLNAEEAERLSASIAAKFHEEASKKQVRNEAYNKNELLDEILDNYAALYDLDNEERANYYEAVFDAETDGSDEALNQFLDKLKQYFDLFIEPDSRKALKEAVDEHLKFLGYQQDLLDDSYSELVDEVGDRVALESWQNKNDISVTERLPKFLRQYIATTAFEYSDEFGNKMFLDGTPLYQTVNSNYVYNALLKSLAGITDEQKMLDRMIVLASEDNETAKFLYRFFNDIGWVKDGVITPQYGAENSFAVQSAYQANLLQAMLKGFNQFYVNYLFINKDISENMRIADIMEANRKNVAKEQFSQWKAAYEQVYEDQMFKRKSVKDKNAFAREKTGVLSDLKNAVSAGTAEIALEDDELINGSKYFSNRLKNNLGISIAPLFIRYSIAANKKPEIRTEVQQKLVDAYNEVKPLEYEQVAMIMRSIQFLENPFMRYYDPDVPISKQGLGFGGAVTRILKMAEGNASLDEKVLYRFPVGNLDIN